MNTLIRLSRKLTLAEMTKTQTGLVNHPNEEQLKMLFLFANYIFQPFRDFVGAITVNSGFRSPLVNMEVGGSNTSQHVNGEAGDLVPKEMDIRDAFRWFVEESRIPYGQCIFEKRGSAYWIHVSLMRLNGGNNQALISPKAGVYLPYRSYADLNI